AADRAHLGRQFHAQAPTRDIDFMDALVAEVAVAVSPVPVPVVVETILLERHLLRRALPQVVIDVSGRIADRLLPDRVPPLVAEAARKIHLADQTFPHLRDTVAQCLAGAALAALLNDAIVLARCSDDLPRFINIVTARLLYVYVLAGLACLNRHERVPVIRRS